MRVFKCTILLSANACNRFEQRLAKTPGMPTTYIRDTDIVEVSGMRADPSLSRLTFTLTEKEEGARIEQLLKETLTNGTVATLEYCSADGKTIIGV